MCMANLRQTCIYTVKILCFETPKVMLRLEKKSPQKTTVIKNHDCIRTVWSRAGARAS